LNLQPNAGYPAWELPNPMINIFIVLKCLLFGLAPLEFGGKPRKRLRFPCSLLSMTSSLPNLLNDVSLIFSK